MASTVFVDFSDPKVNAAWLNDVNAVTYRTLVAGAGVTITPGPGTLTFSASGGANPFAGYTYVNETANRAMNATVYTNSTGKAIQVIADIVTNTDGAGRLTLSGTVDGVRVAVFGVYTHATGSPPPSHGINFWVPAGSSYSVNVIGGPATFSTGQWLEFK